METLNWKQDFPHIISRLQTQPEPFLVSGFFQGPLSGLTNESEFKSKYSDLPLDVVEFDHKQFILDTKDENYKGLNPVTMFLNEFCEKAREKKSLKSYDNLIPLRFVQEIENHYRAGLVKDLLDAEHSTSYYYRFFMGLKGQETEPHLDWTSNKNFLFQIFGTKIVYLVSPEHFHHLPFISNYLELSIEELIVLAREKNFPLIRIVLEPGMGLFIPSYYVHAVWYETDSSSLSLRCAPVKKSIAFHRKFPANQILASLLHHKKVTQKFQEEIQHVKDYESLITKYQETFTACLPSHQIPQINIHSFKYEKHLFALQRSFPYQLKIKQLRLKIIERGAASFGEE